jgi:hypothetical protein
LGRTSFVKTAAVRNHHQSISHTKKRS